MNTVIEMQKRFNLFAVGDAVEGNVLSINKEKTEVKTFGGCFGFAESASEQLKIGSPVKMKVVRIEDGIPVFEFDKDFLFMLSPQTGKILLAGTRGIVVRFAEGVLGYYPVEEVKPEISETAAEGRKVICRSSRKADNCFIIDSLEFSPPDCEETSVLAEKIEEPEPCDVPDWAEDLRQKALAGGSQTRFGKLVLGYCYTAKVYKKETGIVKIIDGHKAQIVGKIPCPKKNGTEVFVRLVNIGRYGRLNAEIVRFSSEHEKMIRRVMEREFNSGAKFDFENGDEKVFAEAMRNHSEKVYGRYKLAKLYSVTVHNGVPYFEGPTPDIEIDVETDANGFTFKENDIVFARIMYMKIDMETKFKVRIEHVIS